MIHRPPAPPAEPRPESGQVEHRPDCPSPRVVRHDGTRVAQLACTSCGAWVTVPRRNEWR